MAQLLKERGFSAKEERRGPAGIPDVRVTLKWGDEIIIECKWEAAATDLDTQLSKRLGDFPNVLGIVGVLYPARLQTADDVKAELAEAKDLRWWVHGSRGVPVSAKSMRVGSVADLADQLRVLPIELEGVDKVVAAAAAIGAAVEESAAEVSKHARLAKRIADAIASTDNEKDRAAAIRIGCLVIFNAIAFQDRLAEANAEAPTVSESLKGGLTQLKDDWRHICEAIDYVPVFDLAANLLDIVCDGPQDLQEAVITPLNKAMAATRQLEGHDLAGRLFHTLLTDAKFTGAYYTSVPAATLLARLVFHGWPKDVDWSDHEYPASLNVADIACGTGTLLMAVAAEAERLHKQAGGDNAAELHKIMVEQALHGYDVQLSAVHFAATTLAMLNPDIQFDKMNLYVMPLGVKGSVKSLGSLDFLHQEEVPVQISLSPDVIGVETDDTTQVSGSGPKGVEQGVTARLPNLDLAIMNPPFTRSVGGNLLFGSLPQAERTVLQRELSRRLGTSKTRTVREGTATAGLGAAFVAAASPRLRPGEGQLALVLPLTVCTGPSWEETRALIERDYTLDYVIASHDPLRWNFSDSTDLSEALLIATRRKEGDEIGEHRTVFINLWRNPDGVLDAHRLAQAITSTTPASINDTGTALLDVGRQHVGEMVSIEQATFEGKKWSGVQFARVDLTRSAASLLDQGKVWVPGGGNGVDVPICSLKELGKVGPDRRDVWDGFERTDSVTAYPMVENHDTEQRKTMATSPDKYLAPLTAARSGRPLKPIHLLWPLAGRLLIAERLWLETTRVFAMWTNNKVLSNVWWPISTNDEQSEKALAVWLNSSLGLLSVLAERTSTRGGWVGLKKADLEELSVMDTRKLSREQVASLADLFDAMAEEEFQRLPNMTSCTARARLDEGIS
ncbi:MAG: hypothetical protein OXK21_00580, partial [Chloroflexota bacterium]|nr:hypothetical protein [Chloroflexota bacterium]